MAEHLSDNELIRLLIAREDRAGARAHITECTVCAARLDALAATEQQLARLGRASRRAAYRDPVAGWASVQARLHRRAHGLVALASPRRLAWSAAALALVLVISLASPQWRAAEFPRHAPAAVAYEPGGANRAGTIAPVAARDMVPTPAPVPRVPATLSGDGTALSQVTVRPEPVPPAPGLIANGGTP